MATQYIEDPDTKQTIPFEWDDPEPPTSTDIDSLLNTVKSKRKSEEMAGKTVPGLIMHGIGRFPSSVGEVVKTGISMATHPFSTAEAIGGYAGKVLRAGREQLLGEPIDIEARKAVEAYAEPVKFAIEHPEQVPRKVGEWAAEHPAEAGLMVSPTFGLTSKVLKAVGTAEKVAETVPRIAKVAEKAGEIAAKAEKVTSPLYPFRPVASAYRKVFPQADLRAVVQEGLVKGGRYAFKGKKTFAETERYLDKGVTAVREIVDNKPNITYTDISGKVDSGRIPHNLAETEQAIFQTKGKIFNQFNEAATQAGEMGVRVKNELRPLARALREYAEREEIVSYRPNIHKYALEKADAIEAMIDAGGYTPVGAQNMISMLNNELKSFIQNPAYKEATQAGIDKIVLDEFRKALDKTISSVKDVKYQELKNKYSALRAIEEDIHLRTLTDARRARRGFFDVSDVFSGYHGVRALVTGDPAGIVASATAKGLSMYYKYMNNPNRAIKNMFSGAERIIEGPVKTPIVPFLPAGIRFGGPQPFTTPEITHVMPMPGPTPSTPGVPVPYTRGGPPAVSGPPTTYIRGLEPTPRLEWWKGTRPAGITPEPGPSALPPGIGFIMPQPGTPPAGKYGPGATQYEFGKKTGRFRSKRDYQQELRWAEAAKRQGVPSDVVDAELKRRLKEMGYK